MQDSSASSARAALPPISSEVFDAAPRSCFLIDLTLASSAWSAATTSLPHLRWADAVGSANEAACAGRARSGARAANWSDSKARHGPLRCCARRRR